MLDLTGRRAASSVSGMGEVLSATEVQDGIADLEGWQRSGPDSITATYVAPTFLAAIALVDAVAAGAEDADHHPDIDIRYDKVTFTLSTHSAGGVTTKDLALAAEISVLAPAATASPEAE
jgi:4a-hydroxytetrahydrobiopterin dehydratase